MINKIKDFIQDKKLSRDLRRSFSATPEDMNGARNLFMAHVRSEFPFSNPQQRFSWKMYTTFAVIALFIGLNGGALIYADSANVPVEHPLYSYKRIAEDVRGFTSTPSQKIKLETQLAERRIQEIKKIEEDEIHKVGKNKDKAVITSRATSTATTTISGTSTIKKNSKNNKKQKELEMLKKNLEAHLKSIEKESEKEKVKTELCKDNKNSKELFLKLKKLCAPAIEQSVGTTSTTTVKENKDRKNKRGQD